MSIKSSLKADPQNMRLDDVSSDDEFKICDMFATFFESVYKPDDVLKNNFTKDKCNNFNFQQPVISTTDVTNAVNKCKLSYSPGPDEIPSCIRRKCCSSLSNVLCYLFNLSLQTHCFPDRWKSSFIIPIFKKEQEII